MDQYRRRARIKPQFKARYYYIYYKVYIWNLRKLESWNYWAQPKSEGYFEQSKQWQVWELTEATELIYGRWYRIWNYSRTCKKLWLSAWYGIFALASGNLPDTNRFSVKMGDGSSPRLKWPSGGGKCVAPTRFPVLKGMRHFFHRSMP